jgi:hypothetical protein
MNTHNVPCRHALGALALATALALTGGLAAPAAAAEHCYDFSGLALGTTYHIGDTVDARHSTITFRPYKMNGNEVGGEVNSAEVQQAQIAGGSAPEMGMKTLAFQLQPKQPVKRVRMRLAQNMTPTGGFGIANLEVNGEQHESPNGFAAADGKRLGGAQISANLVNNAANWHVGTLEIRARPGGTIDSVTIGGHTWRVDNVCLVN